MKTKFIVELEIPKGTTKGQMNDYIHDAISNWKTQIDYSNMHSNMYEHPAPRDPLEYLDLKTVIVNTQPKKSLMKLKLLSLTGRVKQEVQDTKDYQKKMQDNLDNLIDEMNKLEEED